MDAVERERCARKVAGWLRHKPEQAGLTLARGGWAPVTELLTPLCAAGLAVTDDDMDEILHLPGDLRFELRNGQVRARFGHSLDTDDGTPPEMPPAQLYYALRSRRLAAALLSGLVPVKRRHVQLAVRASAARLLVESNPEDTSLILVDAHGAAASGVRFYSRGQGIWVSDAIASGFLKPVAATVATRSASSAAPRTGAGRGGARRHRIIRKPRGADGR